jgi:hypothetical protein
MRTVMFDILPLVVLDIVFDILIDRDSESSRGWLTSQRFAGHQRWTREGRSRIAARYSPPSGIHSTSPADREEMMGADLSRQRDRRHSGRLVACDLSGPIASGQVAHLMAHDRCGGDHR